jgi:hypothetical protein
MGPLNEATGAGAVALEALGDVDQPGEPSFQGPVEAAVVELIAERTGVPLEDVIL